MEDNLVLCVKGIWRCLCLHVESGVAVGVCFPSPYVSISVFSPLALSLSHPRSGGASDRQLGELRSHRQIGSEISRMDTP